MKYETILFFLGNIISDIIIGDYRRNILELRQTQIELLQSESLKVMEELAEDVSMLTKKEEKVKQERNVTKIRDERNLDEMRQKVEEEILMMEKVLEEKKQNN